MSVFGCPVQLVSVPELGVPRTGVTRVGEVSTTNLVPVPVCEAIEVALPTEVMTPVKFPLVVTLPAVRPDAVPVTLVMTPEDGVPNAGVTKVGEALTSVLICAPVTLTSPPA